jgi:hypothetical protein
LTFLGSRRSGPQRERDRPRGRGKRQLHLGRRRQYGSHPQEHQHEGELLFFDNLSSGNYNLCLLLLRNSNLEQTYFNQSI